MQVEHGFSCLWQAVCLLYLKMRPSTFAFVLTVSLGSLPIQGPMLFGAPESRDSNVTPPSGGVVVSVAPTTDRSVSMAYPLTLRRVGYLATVGPAPMRFGHPSPPANERTPPRVPATNRRPELSETAEGKARTEAIETYRSIFKGKVPVPEGSAESGITAPNPFLEQGSGPANSDILEFFQQPSVEGDAQKRSNRFLFDPIFQAAQPPIPGTLPPSRATLR